MSLARESLRSATLRYPLEQNQGHRLLVSSVRGRRSLCLRVHDGRVNFSAAGPGYVFPGFALIAIATFISSRLGVISRRTEAERHSSTISERE